MWTHDRKKKAGCPLRLSSIYRAKLSQALKKSSLSPCSRSPVFHPLPPPPHPPSFPLFSPVATGVRSLHQRKDTLPFFFFSSRACVHSLELIRLQTGEGEGGGGNGRDGEDEGGWGVGCGGKRTTNASFFCTLCCDEAFITTATPDSLSTYKQTKKNSTLPSSTQVSPFCPFPCSFLHRLSLPSDSLPTP